MKYHRHFQTKRTFRLNPPLYYEVGISFPVNRLLFPSRVTTRIVECGRLKNKFKNVTKSYFLLHHNLFRLLNVSSRPQTRKTIEQILLWLWRKHQSVIPHSLYKTYSLEFVHRHTKADYRFSKSFVQFLSTLCEYCAWWMMIKKLMTAVDASPRSAVGNRPLFCS